MNAMETHRSFIEEAIEAETMAKTPEISPELIADHAMRLLEQRDGKMIPEVYRAAVLATLEKLARTVLREKFGAPFVDMDDPHRKLIEQAIADETSERARYIDAASIATRALRNLQHQQSEVIPEARRKDMLEDLTECAETVLQEMVVLEEYAPDLSHPGRRKHLTTMTAGEIEAAALHEQAMGEAMHREAEALRRNVEHRIGPTTET